MTEHIVRFTGRRIGRLLEKPFIIVPSGQNPNGSLRQNQRGEEAYAGAQQRWDDLASALTAEADRIGRDEKGERLVLGEYLESLAQLSMPKQVENMQKAGGPKFGVLDVAITWGNGSKKGPNTPYEYVIEPTTIRSQNLTAAENVQITDQLPVQGVPKTPENADATPKSRSQALANAKSIDDSSGASPSSKRRTSISISRNHRIDTAAPYKRPYRAPSLAQPIRRARGHYHDVLTTKRTQEEEFDLITTAAVSATNAGYESTLLAGGRKGKASYAPAADGSPFSSAPRTSDVTPAQERVVGMENPADPGPVTREWGDPRMQNGRRDFHFTTPVRPPVSTPGVNRREQFPTTQPDTAASDDYFVTPALSEDCVATYAPCGVLRNVGAERGWVFSEEGVIMGARFIIGG